MYYTYLWLREDGTPYYVGKGKDDRAFTNDGHSVLKPQNDERILVQYHPSEEDALEAEKLLIAIYGRKDLGTGCLRNRTEGGDMPPRRKGMKCSEESRRRMSETQKRLGKLPPSAKGIKRSEEFCKAISERLKGNSLWKGKTHSKETLEKMSKAQKGKIRRGTGWHHSKETIEKIRKSNVGQTRTEELKNKLREIAKNNWLKPDVRERMLANR